MKKYIAVFFVIVLIFGFAPNTWADPITGVEINDSFNAPSTNALNYAQQAPGHVGQAAPFVLFVSNGFGEVTLEFTNAYRGGAYFEYRIDENILTSGDPHAVVPGDFEYDGIWIGTALAEVTRTFTATDMVEIRLALGGERDWDFDWTAFRVQSVPEPVTLLLLGLGMVGLAGARRFKK